MIKENNYQESQSAIEFIEFIKNNNIKPNILELGCGWGEDARYFTKNGYYVLATDFNITFLNQLKGIDSKLIDLNEKVIPLPDKSFEAIYSRLCFHYFSNNKLDEIINELYRILKNNGILFIVVKSKSDFYYKKYKDNLNKDGTIVVLEGDLSITQNRNFISKEDSSKIFKNFDIIKIYEYEEILTKYNDTHPSNLLTVIARKKD